MRSASGPSSSVRTGSGAGALDANVPERSVEPEGSGCAGVRGGGRLRGVRGWARVGGWARVRRCVAGSGGLARSCFRLRARRVRPAQRRERGRGRQPSWSRRRRAREAAVGERRDRRATGPGLRSVRARTGAAQGACEWTPPVSWVVTSSTANAEPGTSLHSGLTRQRRTWAAAAVIEERAAQQLGADRLRAGAARSGQLADHLVAVLSELEPDPVDRPSFRRARRPRGSRGEAPRLSRAAAVKPERTRGRCYHGGDHRTARLVIKGTVFRRGRSFRPEGGEHRHRCRRRAARRGAKRRPARPGTARGGRARAPRVRRDGAARVRPAARASLARSATHRADRRRPD